MVRKTPLNSGRTKRLGSASATLLLVVRSAWLQAARNRLSRSVSAMRIGIHGSAVGEELQAGRWTDLIRQDAAQQGVTRMAYARGLLRPTPDTARGRRAAGRLTRPSWTRRDHGDQQALLGFLEHGAVRTVRGESRAEVRSLIRGSSLFKGDFQSSQVRPLIVPYVKVAIGVFLPEMGVRVRNQKCLVRERVRWPVMALNFPTVFDDSIDPLGLQADEPSAAPELATTFNHRDVRHPNIVWIDRHCESA